MKYLIDTNSLSKSLLKHIKQQGFGNFYVLKDIQYDGELTKPELERIKDAGVKIIVPEADCFKQVREIINSEAENESLISMFKNEGSLDVLMLAYVLFKRNEESEHKLFYDEFTIITNDKGLSTTAQNYNVQCISPEEFSIMVDYI